MPTLRRLTLARTAVVGLALALVATPQSAEAAGKRTLVVKKRSGAGAADGKPAQRQRRPRQSPFKSDRSRLGKKRSGKRSSTFKKRDTASRRKNWRAARKVKKVRKIVGEVRPDLMMWDLDNTLWVTDHALGSQEWFDHLVTEGYKGHADARDRAMPRWNQVTPVAKSRPTEKKKTVRAFRETTQQVLEDNGLVIGLTAQEPAVIDAVIKKLKGIGLAMPKTPGFVSGQRYDLGGGAFFQDGIIFSGPPQNKQAALNAFLELAGRQDFRRAVFVDDTRANIDRLTQDPRITGIHYTARRLKWTKKQQAMADYQSRIFDSEGRIPSDAEAKAALKKPR